MGPTLAPHELHQRWEQAMARSTACRERAADLVEQTTASCRRAQRVRRSVIESRLLNLRRATPVDGFRIIGLVDGVPATARYASGVLDCPDELLHRAQVLVGMGETFAPGDGRRPLEASLGGPLDAVLVTVLRAFSQVQVLELGVRPSGVP